MCVKSPPAASEFQSTELSLKNSLVNMDTSLKFETVHIYFTNHIVINSYFWRNSGHKCNIDKR